MKHNPSASQPRENDGRYATTGRPSRRDRGWRTEPGYEDVAPDSDDEPDTPSEAKAARAKPSPPKPQGMPKRGRSRLPESASGKRLVALRERGYRGPIDQDGYATTEAEYMAKYRRDQVVARHKTFGLDGSNPDDKAELAAAEADYAREKKKGDKLRAKWGQGGPRRHQRVSGAAKKAGAAMRPADRAADRFGKKLVRAGARKLAKTIDSSEVI